MATKVRNYFLDDEPPFNKGAEGQQPVSFNQISLEKPVNETVVAPVQEPVIQNEVPEFSDGAKKAIGLTPGQSQVYNDLVQERNNGNAPISPLKPLPTKEIPTETPEVQQVATPTTEQAPENKYRTVEDILSEVRETRTNPILAMIKANEPKIDEKQQQRLRRIAAINSVGQGLGTILQGFYGKKGANIPVTQNTLLPEVYKQYMENQKDYETKLEANRAQQIAAQIQGLDIAQGQIAQERQLKNADVRTKEGQEFQTKSQQDAWAQQEKMAKTQFDQQITMFDKQSAQEYERMAKQFGYQKTLQKMSQDFQASEAQKNRDFQKDLYEKGYKGGSNSGSSAWRGKNAGGAFVFVGKDGKQQVMNAGQDEYIDYVLTKVMEDKPRYYRNKKMLDKYADGKLSENEARQLMGQYAGDYLDINNGIATPKGQAVESQTGGAY